MPSINPALAGQPVQRRSFFNAVMHLARNDVRLIGRDSFLGGMMVYIIATAFILRFIVPTLAENLLENQQFDLIQYYPLIVSYVAVMTGAVMAGMIFGFILLEERDDNTLSAMLVSPMPLRYYMAYRVGMPIVAGFFIIIGEVLIMNLTLIPLWQLVILAAVGAMFASVVALFFATFAENKVQGFALTKVMGSAALLIIVAWFLSEPVQFIMGIFPLYWTAKAYWLAYAGSANWWLALLPGILFTGVLIVLFARRFEKVVYR